MTNSNKLSELYPNMRYLFFCLGRAKDGSPHKIYKTIGCGQTKAEIRDLLQKSYKFASNNKCRIYCFFSMNASPTIMKHVISLYTIYGKSDLIGLDIDSKETDLTEIFDLIRSNFSPKYIHIHETKNGRRVIFELKSDDLIKLRNLLSPFFINKTIDIIGFPSYVLYYPGDEFNIDRVMDTYFVSVL